MRRGRYSLIKGEVKGPPLDIEGIPITDEIPCPSCRRGVVEEVVRIKKDSNDFGIDIKKSTCLKCKGTGWIINKRIRYVKDISELSVGCWIQCRRRLMKSLAPVFVMKIENYDSIFVFDFDQNEVEHYDLAEIKNKRYFFCRVNVETVIE